jgi:hypothetical protein
MTVSKRLKRLCLFSFTALYAAGLTYWMSRLFLRRSGSFGDEISGLERGAGPVHLAAAVFFIFVIGILWARHIEYAVKLGKHRVTGWMFLAFIGFLAGTGICQLYGSEGLIHWAEKYHPWAGVLLLPPLVIHWNKKKRGQRRLKRS